METNTTKTRKPRETKLTIENAGKLCHIRPDVTQDVVMHALVFFAANFKASGAADQMRKSRALKVAESFRVIRETSATAIGDDDSEESAKTLASLQSAFGVSLAVKASAN